MLYMCQNSRYKIKWNFKLTVFELTVPDLYENVFSMADVLGKEMQNVVLFSITDYLLCKDITITLI